MCEIKLKPTYSYFLLRNIPLIILLIVIFFLSLFFDIHKTIKLMLGIISLIILFMIFWRLLIVQNTYWIVNKEQIKYKTGVLSISIKHLELYRVNDYEQNASFLMRIFKIMNLTIYSTDKSNPELKLFGIPKSNLLEEIRKLVEVQREEKNIFESANR